MCVCADNSERKETEIENKMCLGFIGRVLLPPLSGDHTKEDLVERE